MKKDLFYTVSYLQTWKFSFLFLIGASLITQNSFSQNPLVKQWDIRFGGSGVEELTIMKQTADGGFILGGVSFSGISGDKSQPSQGQGDYWIVKTNSLGMIQWEKRFGGSLTERLRDIKQTPDGGYILGGFSSSGISGDKTQPNVGLTDYWIVKIDSLGAKLWDKTFGGSASDALSALQPLSDGGYLLAGFSGSDISGDKTHPLWDTCVTCVLRSDYWIIKTDSAGNFLWDKVFGGLVNENLQDMVQTTDGGFLLVGYSLSGIGGNKTQPTIGGMDYWIVKTDALGNFQWDKDLGGDDDDWLISVRQTNDQGFILGGLSNSGISGDKTEPLWDTCLTCIYKSDYWIIKTDSLGTKLWDKDFGGKSVEDDFGNVYQTADGGYLVGGGSYSQAGGNKTENNLGLEQSWIVKTDANGILEWDKTVFTTGFDEQGQIIQTNDGCFAIANYTDGGIGGDKSQHSQGYTDYWIIKFCDSTATSVNPLLMQPTSYSVFPNPMTETSRISFSNPNNEDFLFTLYDISGRKIESYFTTVSEFILNKGSKRGGVYLFELFNKKTGVRMNGKIMVSD